MASRGRRVLALSSTFALVGCVNLGLLAPSGQLAPSAAPSGQPSPTPAPVASATPDTAATASPSPLASFEPPLFTPGSFSPFQLFGKEAAHGIHSAGSALVVDHARGEQVLSTDGGLSWLLAPHPLTPYGYRVLEAGSDVWAVGIQQQGDDSFIRAYHLTGSTWVDGSAGLPADFYAGAVSGGNLFMVGALGTYVREGNGWAPVAGTSPSTTADTRVPVVAVGRPGSLLALFKGQSASRLHALDLGQEGSGWVPVGPELGDPGYRASMAISGTRVLVALPGGIASLDTTDESATWITDTSRPDASLVSLPSGVYRTRLPANPGEQPTRSYGKLKPDGTWEDTTVPGLGVVGLAERAGYLYAAAVLGVLRRPLDGGTWERVVIDAIPAAARLVADDGFLFGTPGDAGSAKVIPLAGGAWADPGLPTASDGLTMIGSFGTRVAAITLKFGPEGPDSSSARYYMRLGGQWQALELPTSPSSQTGVAGYEDGKAYFYRVEAGGMRLESRPFPGSGSWAQAGPDLPISTTDQVTARVTGGKAWAVRYQGSEAELFVRGLTDSAWQAISVDDGLLGPGSGGLSVHGGRVFLGHEPAEAGPTRIFRVTAAGLVPTANLDLRAVSEDRLDSDGSWLYACGKNGQGHAAIQRMPLDGERWESLAVGPPAQVTTVGGCTVDRAGKRLFVSTADGIWVSQ